MRLSKIVLIICIMIVSVMFANGAYILSLLGRSQQRKYEGSGFSMPDTLRSESSMKNDQPVNLLVLGLDGEGVRTDVILLLNYNPGNSNLNILSVARDTRVYYRDRYLKINALYPAGGEELVASEIYRITGLTANYYITMDFKGFRNIVDALGGIEFNVPFRMDYDDPCQNLHIHLDKGMQFIDGSKAEQLVRYRKGNIPGQGYIDGDIGRIRMQQDFLKVLISQKLNLRYFSKADDVYAILREYVQTNLKLADLGRYLGSVMRVGPEEVNTYTLPGESAVKDGAWYYIYNEELTDEMIENGFFK